MTIEIVDLHIENGDFPSLCKRLPEGIAYHVFAYFFWWEIHGELCRKWNPQIFQKSSVAHTFIVPKRWVLPSLVGNDYSVVPCCCITYIMTLSFYVKVAPTVVPTEFHGKNMMRTPCHPIAMVCSTSYSLWLKPSSSTSSSKPLRKNTIDYSTSTYFFYQII